MNNDTTDWLLWYVPSALSLRSLTSTESGCSAIGDSCDSFVASSTTAIQNYHHYRNSFHHTLQAKMQFTLLYYLRFCTILTDKLQNYLYDCRMHGCSVWWYLWRHYPALQFQLVENICHVKFRMINQFSSHHKIYTCYQLPFSWLFNLAAILTVETKISLGCCKSWPADDRPSSTFALSSTIQMYARGNIHALNFTFN